jgi:hypothetical protein
LVLEQDLILFLQTNQVVLVQIQFLVQLHLQVVGVVEPIRVVELMVDLEVEEVLTIYLEVLDLVILHP